MALGNLFKLAKLTVFAYEDSERTKRVPSPHTFEVQYNPETLSLKHESVFERRQGIATSSAQARWAHSRSKLLNVNLVFDGTQVGYLGVELLRHVPSVAEQIQKFLRVCYRVQSDSHEPAYLKLIWAKGVLGPSFDCRLQSADVQYTAFNRDGSPLHAQVAAIFVEDLDPEKKAALARLASPDVTHRRVVRSGDTLPLLCREIYGSTRHHVRVAEVNELDDLRALSPGQVLIFPPFDKGEEL